MAEDKKQTYNPARFAGDAASVEPLGRISRVEDRLTDEERAENAKADEEFAAALRGLEDA